MSTKMGRSFLAVNKFLAVLKLLAVLKFLEVLKLLAALQFLAVLKLLGTKVVAKGSWGWSQFQNSCELIATWMVWSCATCWNSRLKMNGLLNKRKKKGRARARKEKEKPVLSSDQVKVGRRVACSHGLLRRPGLHLNKFN